MELKEYQQSVLEKFDRWLATLTEQDEAMKTAAAALRKAQVSMDLGDPVEKAWDKLNEERRLPHLRDQQGRELVAPWLTRRDGLNRSIPHVCLKIPTGGGKTLLATSCVERIQVDFFQRQTGFVLWVVPSDAIYSQTWRQLANREHPYRQMLERASGGRVKMLEKADAFTKQDTENYLCVMLLMLPAANRRSKETLRMFRDSGRFTSFFPPEDDADLNEVLLKAVPNLDSNDLLEYGWQDGVTPGLCSLKHSLGNVLRLLRPVVVIDEGHKAYSESARDTINGFNPHLILELSATPNAGGKHSSNVLVAVPGTALKEESMIKLPINVVNEDKGGWKQTLTLAHARRGELEKEAQVGQAQTGRYIRPIMLVRVERTGRDQRDGKRVHAEDAKEYLIERLGVHPEEIRLKTSDKDDLGDEDLLDPECEVRYIITKAALQEGWDCPFAYVLAILSKTTAATALTQMIGRVLRQPYVTLTGQPGLDECHVFTFDQDVTEAVESVRRGLQDEGMADLASQVRLEGGSAAAKRASRREILARRKKYANLPPIFLPQILHHGQGKEGEWRVLDYDRDILGNLDWESFHFRGAGEFPLEGDAKRERVKARIDLKKQGGKQNVVQELSLEESEEIPEEGLDLPFLVRQLLDVIPNPWQGMRIFEETLAILRKRNAEEALLYAVRFDLLQSMKVDLKQQVNEASEKLFREKLTRGEISFRLESSADPELNWELAKTLEIEVSEEDHELHRKNGAALEKSLFERVFQREFNTLEKDLAWYLDDEKTVYWWHRIAVNQASYGIQGWQRNRVFPDFLACVHGVNKGKFRFSVLETKGEHLKGNDDTEYKRKLFELLTAHTATSIRAGELHLGVEPEQMRFTMLMEETWKEEMETAMGCASSH